MEQDKKSIRYAEDKPKECEYCYFWGGKYRGCELEECCYILPPEPEPTYEPGDCTCCPYGKYSPCIGYCIEQIQMELKVGRYGK